MVSLVLTIVGWAIMCVVMHPSFSALVAGAVSMACLFAARGLAKKGM